MQTLRNWTQPVIYIGRGQTDPKLELFSGVFHSSVTHTHTRHTHTRHTKATPMVEECEVWPTYPLSYPRGCVWVQYSGDVPLWLLMCLIQYETRLEGHLLFIHRHTLTLSGTLHVTHMCQSTQLTANGPGIISPLLFCQPQHSHSAHTHVYCLTSPVINRGWY